MKRIIIFTILLVGFLLCGVVSVYADGEEALTVPSEFNSFLSELPDDIVEMLPEGLFSNDIQSAYEASKTLTDIEYLFNAILTAVGLCISECARLFFFLVAVILISTVFHNVGRLNSGSAEIFGFCVKLVIISAIVGRAISLVADVQAYFSRLNVISSASIPVMGVLYALGGNITSAAINTQLMAVFISICQYVNSSTVIPVFGLVIGMALVGSFSNTVRFQAISDAVKKWYTAFLGAIMTLIGIVMSLQCMIGSKADGVSMKGFKYIVSSSIPVVGGAVSSALSGLSAGIELLRSVFGVTAIVVLVLIILPVLLKLFLYKQVFEVTAVFADLISSGGEGKLLRDISGGMGFLMAAASISSVVLIISLVIFTNTAVAFV